MERQEEQGWGQHTTHIYYPPRVSSGGADEEEGEGRIKTRKGGERGEPADGQ